MSDIERINNTAADSPVCLTVQADSRYLAVIRETTGRIAEAWELPEQVRNDIRLAIDEACANVIKHAYGGVSDGMILVGFTVTPKAFQVIIEDSGARTDPALMKGRDLDDVRPGGLGMHFIRRAFDVVAYDEEKKDGNRLILIRHLEEQGA